MTSQAVGPGRRLAGRYRLDDLVDDHLGARTWKAADEVLRRPVSVQTLPGDDPRSAGLARAAREASVVTDTRFLRVLDVAVDDGTTYVVREWCDGRHLGAVLAQGPLPPEQATAVVREVAEGLTVAHRQGLSHLALDPTAVLVTPEGAVKVAGLATDAVLRGTSSDNPGRADATGLGQLLYACLTARWPGPGGGVLAPAPVVDGRVASPRQVRPGIPRALDETVDRALGTPGRQHGPTLGGPAVVLAAVTAAGGTPRPDALRGLVGAGPRAAAPSVDPALDPDAGAAPPPRAPRERVAVERTAPGDRRAIRALAVVAALLFLVGATLLGLQLLVGGPGGGEEPAPAAGTEGAEDTESPAEEATPAGEPTPLPVNVVTDYDPQPGGNGEENPGQVGNAVDGDPTTFWRTQTYFDALELQKPGVGIVLDLGEPRAVRAVRLVLEGEPSGVEIRVAPEDAEAPPEQPDGWTVAAAIEGAGTEVELAPEQPVRTGWLLVWFTQVPPVDGDFRGGIGDVVVLG